MTSDTAAPAAIPAEALRLYADLPGPRPWPLLGNLPQIDRASFHRSVEEGVARFGPVYRLQMGRVRAMVITDRALMLALLRDRPNTWQRGARLSAMLNALGPRGVFSAEGDDWRCQRKLVTRGLNPELIRKFHPTLAEQCQRLAHRWQRAVAAGESPDLFRDLKAMTLDVTVALAMGEDTTSSTLAWAVNLLAEHPQVARRLTEEVDTVLGDARVPEDASWLDRLEYTEAVVDETLRLKPAAPMVAVQSQQERVVGDVRVPPGVL